MEILPESTINSSAVELHLTKKDMKHACIFMKLVHQRAEFFSRIRAKFTSTKALTVATSLQDEDAKRTLLNMLNMLRWYSLIR
nr:hypothetical protein [Tanacetum cinerariifolium]